MNTPRMSSLLTVAAIAMLSACTVSKTPTPALEGPSTIGRLLVITASPDVLSMDGASQSLISIEARDSNGQPAANVQLRVEIRANGQFVDFGSLSARTVVTNANGRASVTYTAPVGASGAIPSLDIYVTPAGTDTNSGFSSAQFIAIRLVPPGVILGNGPTPSFAVIPASPAAFTDTVFDASASKASLGATIVSYSWSFGDGSSATGVQATHRFNGSGTYRVTLTVTDSSGLSTALSQDVIVGGGAEPTADFTFSPNAPGVNQQVNFNGGTSKPGPGHTIVRYDWDFGSGSQQSGVLVSKAYDTAGTYSVVLTVTDESGQTSQRVQAVTVAPPLAPVAAFTFSPPSPTVADTVSFDAFTSSTPSGASINNYRWNFGDGVVISGAPGATAPAPGGTFQAPKHKYSAAGTYSIGLTVTDTNGRSGSTTGTVTVNP